MAASTFAGAVGVKVVSTLVSDTTRSTLNAVTLVGAVVHVAGGVGVCAPAASDSAMIDRVAPIPFQNFIWFSSVIFFVRLQLCIYCTSPMSWRKAMPQVVEDAASL